MNDVIDLISEQIYRALIIDLNIPIEPPLDHKIKEMGDLYAKYPGLYAAFLARNRGYRDRQVIIYSVHKDEAVAEQARRLSCAYLIKGRPREIKQEIDRVVAYDPTCEDGPSHKGE